MYTQFVTQILLRKIVGYGIAPAIITLSAIPAAHATIMEALTT